MRCFSCLLVGFFVFCHSPKKEKNSFALYIELKNLKTKEGFLLIEAENQAGLFSLSQEKEYFKESWENPHKIEALPLEEPTGKSGNWGGLQFRFAKRDPKYLRYTYYRKIPFFCPSEFKLYFFSDIYFSKVHEKNEEVLDSCPKNLNSKVPYGYVEKARQKKDLAKPLSYVLKKEKDYYHAIAFLEEP